MYGLSSNADLSFLFNAILSQVCVGENEVILNWDNGASVTVFGDVGLSTHSESVRIADAGQIGKAAIDLLGLRIDQVRVEPPGTTRILFSSGRVLELYDSWSDYESYTMSFGSTNVIV